MTIAVAVCSVSTGVGSTVGREAASSASIAASSASARFTRTVLPNPRQYNALAARNSMTSRATPIRCSSDSRLNHWSARASGPGAGGSSKSISSRSMSEKGFGTAGPTIEEAQAVRHASTHDSNAWYAIVPWRFILLVQDVDRAGLGCDLADDGRGERAAASVVGEVTAEAGTIHVLDQ